MRTRATALAAVALAVTAAFTVSACSNTNTGAPVSEANLSGTPITASDDITALCKQIVEQKLPVEAAAALAETSGYVTRVSVLDGKPQAVTMDLREDRLTFEVTAGVVTACTTG